MLELNMEEVKSFIRSLDVNKSDIGQCALYTEGCALEAGCSKQPAKMNRCGVLKVLGQAFSDPCSPEVQKEAEQVLFNSLLFGDSVSQEAALSVLLRSPSRISSDRWYELKGFMEDPANAGIVALARVLMPDECEDALSSPPPEAA
ncbi:MAG: hypothetical protein WC745_04455 [Patescibacteria group bacterium]